MIAFIFLLLLQQIALIFYLYRKVEENKSLSKKISELEIEKNNLLNEIKLLNKFKEDNGLINKKNDELIEILNQKDKKIDELQNIKNNFENLYKVEKATHSEKEEQLNKYILELIEKNKEIIDKSFEEKNKISSQNLLSITNNLMNDYKKITERVLDIENKSTTATKLVDELKNSLMVPHKAGHTSEITLENILLNSGLRKKNSLSDDGDYITQASIKTGDNFLNNYVLRPDAIVYLPNNNYLIIDSKTSSQFVELQEAIDSNNIEKKREVSHKIKERLNKHLNDLISKDYKKALYESLNINSDTEPTIMTIMFVQTEGIMSLIRKIDPTLENRALEANIPIASPLGLINLLNISKYTIHKDIQDKNIDKLKQEIRYFVDNLSTIFERTEKVGKKLYESIINYNDLTTTFNSNLLTRIKNMQKLGIQGNKKKELPNKLSRYELQKDIIDGEITNINENKENLIEE